MENVRVKTLIYWNFKKYEGEFKNDKRHGEGTFTDEADGVLWSMEG